MRWGVSRRLPKASSDDGKPLLVLGLFVVARFVMACFISLSGRFGQAFQCLVEPLFGFVRPGLFGRFPKLLNLGLFRYV